MACACLPAGVPLMPRDRGGIGRTGSKQKRSKAAESSQTSPKAAEATAGTVAEADAAAEAAEQAPPVAIDEDNSCNGQKRVRFERNPPRATGLRRVLPASEPWSWGGRWNYPTDHPMWSRHADGTPREADLQTKAGTQALSAHRWGLRVAEHVAGGFESAWPTDSFRFFDTEWKDSRTHRRWCPRCPKNEPTWARVCEAGGVQSEVSGVVDE